MPINVGGTDPVFQYVTATSANNIPVMVRGTMLSSVTAARTRSKENALHSIFKLLDATEAVGLGVSASTVKDWHAVASIAGA